MSSTKITYIGHATLLIEMNGLKILTDPILGKHLRYIVFFRRKLKPGRTLEQLLEDNIDAILLSHSHLDHYHVPTLRKFPEDTPFFVPLEYKSKVKSAYKHFKDIHELDVWQKEEFNGITITAVPAHHPREGQGYVIEGNHTLYFPGDTGLFEELHEFPNRFQRLDVVFLPMMPRFKFIRRFNPHIDAFGALEMVKILKPKYAIPIHFGFYPMRNYLQLPLQLKDLLEKEGLIHLFYLLENGETLQLI
ncbi:MAG: MBL fold metallo-hydrolase [Candidatus Helarchaeota archaeon]|nr:MBL fold metallo-hydrolase [Candidatus Helarchaeota archaeon]